jgi:hypothetical protein
VHRHEYLLRTRSESPQLAPRRPLGAWQGRIFLFNKLGICDISNLAVRLATAGDGP